MCMLFMAQLRLKSLLLGHLPGHSSIPTPFLNTVYYYWPCQFIQSREHLSQRQGRLKSSFIRPSRQRDPAVSFNEALVTKYAAGNPPLPGSEEEEIRIGGKTVEEVGFQKIREIQRNVSQLGILILDGCRIAGINDEPLSRSGTGDSGNVKSRDLLRLGLKAVELDLSNNLIEDWGDVVLICDALPGLRSLVLEYVSKAQIL